MTDAARAGYYGRFPELPQKVLGREPNANEIKMLITDYVSNKGSRGESTEKKLMELARTYLSPDDAEKEIARIHKFIEEWEDAIDL